MKIWLRIILYLIIKCDIMTEHNISNIATASETFTKPVQPVLKHQLFISVNVIDENVHHFYPFLAYLSDFRFGLLHGSPSSSISRLLIQIIGGAFSAK